MRAKLVANLGFFISEIAVILLGTTAGHAPTWLTDALTIFACIAVFVASVANYAEGLNRGCEIEGEAKLKWRSG